MLATEWTAFKAHDSRYDWSFALILTDHEAHSHHVTKPRYLRTHVVLSWFIRATATPWNSYQPTHLGIDNSTRASQVGGDRKS